jgi:hypothetical protein
MKSSVIRSLESDIIISKAQASETTSSILEIKKFIPGQLKAVEAANEAEVVRRVEEKRRLGQVPSPLIYHDELTTLHERISNRCFYRSVG